VSAELSVAGVAGVAAARDGGAANENPQAHVQHGISYRMRDLAFACTGGSLGRRHQSGVLRLAMFFPDRHGRFFVLQQFIRRQLSSRAGRQHAYDGALQEAHSVEPARGGR